MKLADLYDRHAGQTVWVCGTAPSLDRPEVDAISGPRIYLNRVAFALPRSAGETYWLVVDDAWTLGVPGPWRETLDDLIAGRADMIGVFRDPLMLPRGGTAPPAARDIAHWSGKYRPREAVLRLDRRECAAFGLLYQMSGTAAPAIHLAYLMGAARVRLVGVDGTDGYASRLRQFYDRPARGGFGYAMGRIDALKVAGILGLEIDDLCKPRQEAHAHAHV